MAQIQVADPLGRKVWVPAHWMDHPVLKRGFRRLPSQRDATPRSSAQAAAEPQTVETIDDGSADPGEATTENTQES